MNPLLAHTVYAWSIAELPRQAQPFLQAGSARAEDDFPAAGSRKETLGKCGSFTAHTVL